MSNVFSAHAVSIDGYVSGRHASDPDGGFDRGLGDAPMLFDWYSDGDPPMHQVPILLGGGRPVFPALPEHVRLNLVEAIPAPGATHLHYEVLR